MQVRRVLSNNAVVAVGADGQQVVALGRGIGHGRRPGDELDGGRIEQIFVATGDAARDQLSQFVADLPLECVRAASKVAELAHERLGIPVTQALILPLADHLAFAVRRRADGITLQLPLVWEISQLYPDELAVGRESIVVAGGMLGVELDADEAAALAMHFVNSQFAAPGVSAAMRMTESISRILDLLESSTTLRIDRTSMSTARFVTHLRYLYVRIAGTSQHADPNATLSEAIANAHPEAMSYAEKIAHLIGMDTNTTLNRDEIAYLALHVARLLWVTRDDGARGAANGD